MKYVMAILMLLILVTGCAPFGNAVTSPPQTPAAVDNQSSQVQSDAAAAVQQPTPQPPETTPEPAVPPKMVKITYLAHSCLNLPNTGESGRAIHLSVHIARQR